MHVISTTPARIETGGGGVVAHVGLHALGRFADALGMGAALVGIHSEHKQGTWGAYKRGFGFQPMFCVADATGETLAALLRPGNATANDAADHLTVLDNAIGQLPAEIASGHHCGDDPATGSRPVMVRADSAGATAGFVWGCRDRNIGFAV